MGQNNDATEHGDLQGQQGARVGVPRSSYLPDGKGPGPLQTGIPLADAADKAANNRYNVREFASKHGLDADMAEKIIRLYGPNREACDRAATDTRRRKAEIVRNV